MQIVASAPARISLLGGGSDLAEFSDIYGGAVISMAINLRSHVTLNTEDDIFNSYNVFPQSCRPELSYALTEAYNLKGFHRATVKSKFDGWIGAGLGASGAFSVALVAALEKLNDRSVDPYTIAERAYKIELGVHRTGRQDHYAAAYGGFNLFTFGQKNESIPLSKTWAEKIYPYMVLYYIGGNRESSNVQMNKLSPKKIEGLHVLRDLIFKAIKLMGNDDIEGFIGLIDDSWRIKKKLNNKVSNEKIDKLYDKGIVNGALAGKLLGAGAGGYFLFFVDPSKRKEFIKKMDMEVTDFQLDWQGVEARIV